MTVDPKDLLDTLRCDGFLYFPYIQAGILGHRWANAGQASRVLTNKRYMKETVSMREMYDGSFAGWLSFDIIQCLVWYPSAQ